MTLADRVTDRLRAAGCVFAEEEAALLLEAARARDGAPVGDGHADVGVDTDRLETLLVRRVAGEPLEHLLGWAELAGRRWSVGPGVFVPRRRSELLVRTAVGAVRTRSVPMAVVVDLCCGSGAVGGAVTLALTADDGASGAGSPRELPVELHAADVDPAATAHARTNLEPLGGHVHTGDLFDPLPRDLAGRVDLLLCHAPYVPSDAVATMPPEAREHEPLVALDGGADGLDVVRRVVAAAPRWLAPGGSLFFEAGRGQVTGATALVSGAGLTATVVRDDDPDDDDATGGLVVVGTRTP